MRTILIAAALLAPGTAWAASGDIGCIEAKLGPTAMQRIGDGVVAAVDKGGNPAAALDADRDALLAARQACRSAGNWSPGAVQAAVSYTQGKATKLGAEAALRNDGLDAARLAMAYAALPVDDRRSLIEKASAGALTAVTAATKGAQARRHVLLFYSALAAIEFYPAEFANL
ncbi:hypothetical protein [Sphingomonas asaccharolytica]|uniref:hypothetical protein n=1 Tax=Sphingomonas asaccharolytica TaxID=40681 RepID=UPI000833F937|nr:hypothetical protein [Sphingomonas asaccharolytica]